MSIFLNRALTHAQNNPDRVIIADKWKRWSWSALITRAREYGLAIQTHRDFNKSKAVPIIVGRSGEVAAAVLGTLMNGYPVALLSANQPVERISKCLDLLGSNAALDARNVEERLSLNLKQSLLEAVNENIKEDSGDPADTHLGEDDLLYILFTSGSTGEPKGVMCSHANIVNTLEWSTDLIDWREGDVIGNATQFSFDIASFDLFTCFYYGVPLAIFPDPANVNDVFEQIESASVTSIFATPAFFSQFVRTASLEKIHGSSLRRILSGGDFFPPAHILDWRQHAPQVDVFNVWGPTETSIVNTMHLVNDNDLDILKKNNYPSIGREHTRMSIILMGEDGSVVSKPSERGEICMLGQCVSHGYLNNETLSNDVYTNINGVRAFRTGDIAYMDEDKNLFMVGRTGSIIKLAGYRIDLGEVEAALTSLDGVHLAGAFVVENEHGISELYAALEVGKESNGFDIFSAKKILRKKLPGYMVPKKLFPMEKLPLNANGKIDRNSIKESLRH